MSDVNDLMKKYSRIIYKISEGDEINIILTKEEVEWLFNYLIMVAYKEKHAREIMRKIIDKWDLEGK